MLSGLNPRMRQILLARFSDPEELYHARRDALEDLEGITKEALEALENKDLSESQKIVNDCRRKNIGILAIGDEAYPRSLKNIEDPPVVLYYRGHLPDFEEVPVISVVGTRKATVYGMNTARQISRQIAACGALVVSGGASGIDSMAMQGAMEAGKPTVGVLGCGVDVVYPVKNRRLFEKTVEQGCLLSEYPPGSPPLGWHFPLRNRIISGLANGILVVEAPIKSGALITSREALEQGRDVFVIPGNIDVPACQGSNALLQDGAAAVFSGWDIVREYEALYSEKVQKCVPVISLIEEAEQIREAEPALKVAQNTVIAQELSRRTDKKDIDNGSQSHYSGINEPVPELTGEERQILDKLQLQPRSVDDVIAELDMPASKVLGVMTMLALKGVVINHPGKRISLKRKLPD